MAIFDRIRRTRASRDAATAAAATLTPVPTHLLPEVNQRVTVTMGEHVPLPSRVEDVTNGSIVLASPAMALEFGDHVVVTWERDDAWFSLDTCILGMDEHAAVPTVKIAAGGRLSRFDERRTDVRRAISLPIELRVLRARAVRPTNALRTHTSEVSSTAVRFATTAPFAPGDLMEATIQLGDGTGDTVKTRLRVIRIDSVTGSWRSVCTATFDEILRSDRARILAVADATGTEIAHDAPAHDPALASTAPTSDGVGGRDQPEDLASLEHVVDWLKRRS